MDLRQISVEDIRSCVFFTEIVTAVLSLVFYKKYKGTFLRYFPLLIWYSVANEMLGKYYSEHVNVYNAIFFNIYRIVEFTFYFLLFRNLIESKRHKQIITIFMVVYYISVIINCFVQDFQKEYFSNTYYIGAVFTIISITFYLSKILNSEKIISVTRSFAFWVSTAAFLLYITSMPFKIMMRYFEDSSTIPYIYMSNYAVVFIFFVIISFGLIWSKAEQQF